MHTLMVHASSRSLFRLPTLTFAAFIIPTLVLTSAAVAQVHVDIAAGTATGSHDLPLGQDLLVSLNGFQAGESLSVELYAPDGHLLLAETHSAGPRGSVPTFRLWRNTGIRGCDSGLPTQAYPFLGIDDAQAWIYSQAMLVVSSPVRRTAIARTLSLIPDPLVHGFPTDKDLCFQRRFEAKEPILLDLRPGQGTGRLPVYTIWVLPCDLGPWTPDDVLVDARASYPNGQTLNGNLPAVIQLVDINELADGKYGILVRETSEISGSTSRSSTTSTLYVPMGPIDVGPATSDPGTDIDDWNCIVGTGGNGGGADP